MIDTTDKTLERALLTITGWLCDWVVSPLSDDSRDRAWEATGPKLQQSMARSFTSYEKLGPGTNWNAPHIRAAFAKHLSIWAASMALADARHAHVNLPHGPALAPVVTMKDGLRFAVLDRPEGPMVELVDDLSL